MKGKLIYAALVLLLLASALWQWQLPLIDGDARKIAPPQAPSMPAALPKSTLDAILAHNLWDKERGQLVANKDIASVLQAGAGVSCQLKGIAYAQMQAPQAMVACDGKLILLHEGAELPDHSRLREIHADHVVVERAGEMRREYLFGKK